MHEPIQLDVLLMESNAKDVIERSKLQLLAWLHALTAHDRFWLETNASRTPTLYSSGAQYERDQKLWRDPPRVVTEKLGNCKDFAAWRVAELRMAGIKCKPFIMWNKLDNGFWQFHAVVYREGPETPVRNLPLTNEGRPMPQTPFGKPTIYRAADGMGWVEDPSRVLGMGWNEA